MLLFHDKKDLAFQSALNNLWEVKMKNKVIYVLVTMALQEFC
jgi:hypothetical protein